MSHPVPVPADPLALHSVPTRRSSDLAAAAADAGAACGTAGRDGQHPVARDRAADFGAAAQDLDAAVDSPGDRKSTRLNSSHLGISYAVFCLKKKIHKS